MASRTAAVRQDLRQSFTGRQFGHLRKVAAGGAAEIDTAAKAARAAFPAWRELARRRRAATLLHKIADAIEARADEIALVESIDTGQPIRYMTKAAMRGAENFRFFADRAP